MAKQKRSEQLIAQARELREINVRLNQISFATHWSALDYIQRARRELTNAQNELDKQIGALVVGEL